MPALTATVIAFAPGRVNLIGEHTDYNDGLALPFAIERGVTVSARLRSGSTIEVLALDLGERDEFELDATEQASGWRAFARGTVAELRGAGMPLGAAVLEISGDLRRGSGLASSGALTVALALALIELHGDRSRAPQGTELARLCSRVENEWVGTQSGLLDQLASIGGQAGSALRIDFRSLALEAVPLSLPEHRLLTLDSGEQHCNASSGYNHRRRECARACELLGIASLRGATLEDCRHLPDPLHRRVRHVLEENERVEAAVQALRERDLSRLGELLDASHASLRDLYDVSTPAVEAAVRRLRDAGALGARVMGGGFGGSVLGLLPAGTPAPPGAVEVRPGAGARLLAQ